MYFQIEIYETYLSTTSVNNEFSAYVLYHALKPHTCALYFMCYDMTLKKI